jgi:hypothetical protein
MASTRLTNPMRTIIRDRMLDHAFSAREKALAAQQHALAREVYDRLYPKEVQKLMNALPEGYLSTDDDLMVVISGEYHTLKYAPGIRLREASDSRRLAILSSDPLGERILAANREDTRLMADKRKQRDDIWGVLTSVSTLNKLLEMWPEVESFTTDLGSISKPIVALARP